MSKLAVVTGGATGIGLEICRSLSLEGYKVICVYHSSVDAALRLENVELSMGRWVKAVQMDLESPQSIDSGLKLIDANYGSPGILINNAAFNQQVPFLDISESDLNKMYQVNLKAPFQLTQSLLPGMIANGWGRIVNITSIGGQWGGTKQIHYAVMKSGLIGLTTSIAKTFSSEGITCNAVAPGLIATEMITTELPTKEREEVAKTIPVGRIGETSDVANVVKFLVSDSASYLTGQTVNVNGGMYFS